MDIGWAGTLLLATTGAIVGAASLYLLGLALAALRPPRAAPLGGGHSRLAVIVPAHNEAELLPRCLASLRAQDYPPDRFEVLVVADNCTDSTAAVARDGGARVLVRDQPDLRGKGRALRWAMDSLLSSANPPDAVVVVDADSVADTALLRSLEGAMLAGAEAVQAEYLALGEASSGATLRQASFLLFHRTRFAGRAALGMACSLVGNGMLFTRSLLERMPWNAFTGAEDLEYSTELRLRGVRPVFTSAAGVAAPAAGFGRGAATQRMRWEGGRFHVARTRLPDLMTSAVRRRDWSLLDAAADLAVPPLGLLVMLALLGGAAGLALWVAGLTPLWVGIIWWAALLAIAGHVLIGLRAARAPASAYRALLQTPRFLVVKLGTYLRMSRGLRADRWERTERPSEAGHGVDRPNPPTGAQRLNVCGVPIDPVDRAQAVDRILASVGSGSVLQVCTVNLQFLVTARRRPEVRRALGDAGLNLADGAPVTWLARLLGRPLPGRVAGADLVPALAARSAQTGARLFLLGGRDGAAVDAAAALRREHPDLIVCGIHEPPFASVAEMDDAALLSRVEEAAADILLVGFGHPKQDLWIAAHRDMLPVSVAIGVGGTFDLLAGRLRRAPRWARRSGLEWCFRLAQEPRRLALRYAACATWLIGVLVPMAAWQRIAGANVTTAATGSEVVAVEAQGGSVYP